jgi:hypothetical protein
LLFTPCEKALVDQNNNLSLIVAMEELRIDIPESVDVPPKALGMLRWDVVTAWAPTADDGGRRFQQKIEILAPDDTVIGRADVIFQMQAGRNHRNTVRMVGFPVGPPGQYGLRLLLREDQAGSEFREISTYPLHVKRGKSD